MDDTYQVKVAGEDREVLMSFGLLDDLAREVGDVDSVALIGVDANLRTAVLRSLLSKRDTKGRIQEELSIFDIDMTPKQVNGLLDWAGAHLLDFFLTSMEQTKATVDRNQDRVKALMPTSPGGED